MRFQLVARLNNISAFLSYTFFYLLFNLQKNKTQNQNATLIINTGTLGDVIISSILLENQNNNKSKKIYYLIAKEYTCLFNRNSSIKFIPLNKRKYKWSYFYKYKFLKALRRLGIDECYNMTEARGISSDEIALLSGAGKTYCLYSDWKKLVRVFGNLMDRQYSEILFKEKINVYDRHFFMQTKISDDNKSTNNSPHFSIIKISEHNVVHLKKYIVIAPFSSDQKRTFGIGSFLEICDALSQKINVVIIGSPSEKQLFPGIYYQNNVHNMIGKIPLEKIPSVIKKSELFIGNDSGLSHLALRLDVPLIAIIGGGNYGKYFPFYINENQHYYFHQLECFGCEWRCKYPERYCLTNVSSFKIIQKSQEILKLKNTNETS